MFQPLILSADGVFFGIGHIHEFIGHCLIPLDPCFTTTLNKQEEITKTENDIPQAEKNQVQNCLSLYKRRMMSFRLYVRPSVP